ncbi:type II toxin-antitoxin system VapC family toxin [Candidatus Woesearchaeota archaeon]|nr:type II toxin-antitoxin system VapC family toxin [Candidatus Woesearchaeota archaeon]
MDKVVFIDTNIFLEIFLGDIKSNVCMDYLASLNEQKIDAVTTDFVVYSCILIIQNKTNRLDLINNVIIFFNSYPLKILRPSLNDLYDSVKMMKNYTLDFDDALVLACMKNNGIKDLVSMDKHFDKIKDISRIGF